jgi:signal transduction histidine kinase
LQESPLDSHRFLRAVFDSLSSHLAILDDTGTIVDVNAAWRRFAEANGYGDTDHGVGTNYLARCESGACPEGADAARGIRAVLDGGLKHFTLEYACHSASQKRWFIMRVTPLATSGPVHVVAAHENITAERLASETLREADQKKDEFLATLGHELRNPLAPIRNAVNVLRLKSPSDPVLEQAHDVIERQVAHLTRLVDDLLEVSRITRGKVSLQTEALDIARIVEQAVETSRPLIRARRHSLTVAVPESPVSVRGDAVRLVQVLSNLLNNAAKYTEVGGTIRLDVERSGAYVNLSVTDNGIGISQDMLPRVFDMFTQAESALDRAQGGLGIGLTLVKRLVEMHGGSVEARSAGRGFGSEFRIRLPLLDESEMAGLAAVPGQPHRTARSRRVLLVDDNIDAAESLAILLRLWGHEVLVAHDGQAAVVHAAEWRPDVMFVDIELPRLDGHGVAQAVRNMENSSDRVTLVAMTGYGREEDRRRSRESGFDQHFVKPIDLARLKSFLE